MIKSRLIEVLKTFSKKEIREFGKWLNSPFHNQRQDVIDLYDYLLVKNNLAHDSKIKKEIAFKYIYKNEKFDDAKMRQVMHFMFKNIENFFVHSKASQSKSSFNIQLSRIYRQKKIFKLSEKHLGIAKSIQEQSNLRDNDYFETNFLIQKETHSLLTDNKKSATELNLQQVSDAGDISFIANKLKQACLMVANQSVYSTSYDIGLLDEILEHIQNSNLLNIPVIAIYFYSYKTMVDKENDENFKNLKILIEKHNSLFKKLEIADIYLMGINYCIGKINKGNKTYFREAFELFKTGFEKKILVSDNGRITKFSFQNAISVALGSKEFVWVENFIEEYKIYLNTESRESLVYFNLARLFFQKGEYQKAMEFLMHYEHKNVLINLTAKVMLIKIYYELSEFRALESLLESLRAYIARKKTIGYHKAVYKNIIRYTKKLLKVNPYSKAQKEKLKLEIEAAKPLTEKAWLLKQLSEL